MSTANALASTEGGADFMDAAVLGVGDRGGTAALEEVACALEVYGFDTGMDLTLLPELAETVARGFGITTQVEPDRRLAGQQEGELGPLGPGRSVGEPDGHRRRGDRAPFGSIIDSNVIFKQKGSDYGGAGFVADVLEAEGRPFTTEALERIESRIVDALISRKGMISEQEFWAIAESVLGYSSALLRSP